jgi:hypothetical protein
MSTIPIETIIAQAEPETKSNRFIIGAFEPGITLYRQQVRALNVIYAIHEEHRIKPGDAIAVIGGGVSGVTVAAAAIVLGYEVYLFESQPMLCHLQNGCDIRWVHPHLYDWPRLGSERPYAEIPILNWRAGTAAHVVEQILDAFGCFKDSSLHIHCGASISIPESLRVEWQESHGDPSNGAAEVKAIIFAIGFGVERYVENGTISYWRNDSVSQSRPGMSATDKTSYLVSGTGDGGLIDLLRIRVEKFNQDRIISELLGSSDVKLLSRLRDVHSGWAKERAPKSTWLYDRYEELYKEGLLTSVIDKLKSRLRKDTSATLNGRTRFSQALRLDTASVFNTFITYCLFSLGGFKYKKGDCEFKSASEVLIDSKPFSADKYIIRHGTDRASVIKAVEFEEAAKVISSPDPIRRNLDTSRRLWPAGWWGDNAKRILKSERIEFVSPSTQVIATTFVSTLSDILKSLHEDTKDLQFRITLHRTIDIGGNDFLQQISRYAGTRTSGTVGRVFSVDAGLIGLASRLGQPVCIKKHQDFSEVWEKLHFEALEARAIHKDVKSLLACPFFVSSLNGGRPERIALVLFIDSGQEEFFRSDVLKMIYAACRGFVHNLENMKSNREIFFASSAYEGYKFLRPQADLELISGHESILIESEIFRNFIEDLTFNTVRSFDTFLER